MKKIFRKVLSLLLCVTMFITTNCVNFAYATSEDRKIVDSGCCGLYGDNLKWVLYSDGELIISGNGEMNWYYVDHSNGGKETTKSAPWSKYYNDISVITIEEGVTSIGNDSFVGKNIQYYRINIPQSIKYFECLEDFGGNLFDTIKAYQTKGKHISFCYAGSESDWDAIKCKHYRVLFNESSKEYERTLLSTTIENRIEYTGFQDYQAVYFSGEEPTDFCEIQRTTSTVTINPFEKVELYAHYYIDYDERAEFVWTIDGEGVFLNGEADKTTTGKDVTLLFLDDTTVKLQVVTSSGNIISEDEITLKSYNDKSVSVFERIKYSFLMILIVFVGMFGGTVGPWIGSLI